ILRLTFWTVLWLLRPLRNSVSSNRKIERRALATGGGRSRRADSANHESFHVAHGVFPAVKHSLRNDGVANIEFSYAWQSCDTLHIIIVQSVAGVHAQAQPHPVRGAASNAFELLLNLFRGCIRIGSRVQFNDWGA